ncbi:hypothetical protein EVAR_18352_1 [Eumeta japonica]|uniref:Uncharacterized protein n=1 Tax=Eumeta variegata TaxID=151549 RepID=A0A4C1V984_EUMVA|nr:hypothetical protein EVAR_18352_1 [Eumeta japonica]
MKTETHHRPGYQIEHLSPPERVSHPLDYGVRSSWQIKSDHNSAVTSVSRHGSCVCALVLVRKLPFSPEARRHIYVTAKVP